jgi:hypothetical protein
MTAEHTDVVRQWGCQVHEWIRAGSPPDELDAVIERFFEPDADFVPVAKFPDPGPWHGRDAFARFMRLVFREAWAWRFELDTLVPVGDDGAIACGDLHTAGHSSGVGLSGRLYECYWFRNRRIRRLEHHATERGALRAFGLDAETFEAAGLTPPR